VRLSVRQGTHKFTLADRATFVLVDRIEDGAIIWSCRVEHFRLDCTCCHGCWPCRFEHFWLDCTCCHGCNKLLSCHSVTWGRHRNRIKHALVRLSVRQGTYKFTLANRAAFALVDRIEDGAIIWCVERSLLELPAEFKKVVRDTVETIVPSFHPHVGIHVQITTILFGSDRVAASLHACLSLYLCPRLRSRLLRDVGHGIGPGIFPNLGRRLRFLLPGLHARLCLDRGHGPPRSCLPPYALPSWSIGDDVMIFYLLLIERLLPGLKQQIGSDMFIFLRAL